MAAQTKQRHAVSKPTTMLLGSNPQGLSLEFEKKYALVSDKVLMNHLTHVSVQS